MNAPPLAQQLPDPTEPPRRPIDMEALKSFLYSIGSYVDAALILSPDKDLFHYTTLDGFLSILKNGDLWLTDSRYCNDEEELVHGHRVAMKVVEEELGLAAADPIRKAFLERVRELVIKPPSQGGVHLLLLRP